MSRLLAAIYDPFMRRSEEACLRQWRDELLAGLAGDVLEIGAGTGANLPHYPATVRRLVVTEPDPAMRARLARRPVPPPLVVETAGVAGHRLPFGDASFDAVVGTLVLCSVEDPAAVLGELHRVLRPGGSFAFLEHVAATDPARLAWQRRIEPVWRRIADNCHLTRRTEDAIVAAGFTLDWVKRESMRKALPILRPTVRGRARRPAAPGDPEPRS